MNQEIMKPETNPPPGVLIVRVIREESADDEARAALLLRRMEVAEIQLLQICSSLKIKSTRTLRFSPCLEFVLFSGDAHFAQRHLRNPTCAVPICAIPVSAVPICAMPICAEDTCAARTLSPPKPKSAHLRNYRLRNRELSKWRIEDVLGYFRP